MQGSETGTMYIGKPGWHLIHVNRSYSFSRETALTVLNTLPTNNASWQKWLHSQSESHDIVTTSHREQTPIPILNNQWEGAWWGRLSWKHHRRLVKTNGSFWSQGCDIEKAINGDKHQLSIYFPIKTQKTYLHIEHLSHVPPQHEFHHIGTLGVRPNRRGQNILCKLLRI